jgi:SAM-dependent methyltransferase
MGDRQVSFKGFCPICGHLSIFAADDPWARDHLLCLSCNSIPRERALMIALTRVCPDWRTRTIHESSPVFRGMSALMLRECRRYIPTYYFPHVKPGENDAHGFRCENIEQQTFPDQMFDIVITQDVLEHVFHPEQAHREIHRTLRPHGFAIHTFPIYKDIAITRRVASIGDDATISHHEPPEYHGDPIDKVNGALVTFRYGYDVGDLIAGWASFNVEISRYNAPYHGVLGEFTEVVTCAKSGLISPA